MTEPVEALIRGVPFFRPLERVDVARREQQRATAEILRVISGSAADAQPVFDAIARNAMTLWGALYGAVFRFDGTLIHVAARHNWTPQALEVFTRMSRRWTGSGR